MNTAVNRPAAQRPAFACYSGEQLRVTNGDARKRLELTDADKLILAAVDQLLVTTCSILYAHLCGMGLKDVGEDDLRAMIRRLADGGYLARMELVAPRSRASYRVYALGAQGREFLCAGGRRPRLSGYIDKLDATGCKRLLAATQFVIRRGLSVTAQEFGVGSIVAGQSAGGDGAGDRIFRPQCIVQQQGSTMFVEAVRAGCGSIDALRGKLRRMDDTLRHSRYTSVNVQRDVAVVIVCESPEHMREVDRAICGETGRYCFRVLMTNDVDVFAHPQRCLYSRRRRGVLGRLLAAPGRLVAEG